ncbi:unnamed protein product, partial [Meganyctiphanes norvegica]
MNKLAAELGDICTNWLLYDLSLKVRCWPGYQHLYQFALPFNWLQYESIGRIQRGDLSERSQITSDQQSHSYIKLNKHRPIKEQNEIMRLPFQGKARILPRQWSAIFGSPIILYMLQSGINVVIDSVPRRGSFLQKVKNRLFDILSLTLSSRDSDVTDTYFLKMAYDFMNINRSDGVEGYMKGHQRSQKGIFDVRLIYSNMTKLGDSRRDQRAPTHYDTDLHKKFSLIKNLVSIENVSGPSIFDGPAAVANKWLQQQQQQPQQQQQQQQEQQPPKSRGNSVLTIGNYPVIPSSLEALLEQLSLSTYISVFREQGVDLHLFLTLTDQDLKDCGIQT